MPNPSDAHSIAYGAAVTFGPTPENAGTTLDFRLPDEIDAHMRDVLGDARRTQTSLRGGGYVAAIPGPPGAAGKTAEFGPLRLVAETPSANDTAAAMVALMRLYSHAGWGMVRAAYGLNLEFDIPIDPATESDAWLAERFCGSGAFRVPTGWSVGRCAQVKFQAIGPEDLLRNIDIQPRAEKPNYLYVHVNCHNSAFGEFDPTSHDAWSRELEAQYRRAVDFICQALE